MLLSFDFGMQRFALILLILGCGFAADHDAAILKERYLALTDSWARDIEFTPAEIAAMESGRKWEPLMMKGPDDPLGKRMLAAGEPSYDALASYYPGKILDRTVLGTYSDPHQPLGDYNDEFTIYWNGAIACNLIKKAQPVAHNTVILFRVGTAGEQMGRVRSRYSSIGYEDGYLPIVTAAYEYRRCPLPGNGAGRSTAGGERWLGYCVRAIRNDQHCGQCAYGGAAAGHHPQRRGTATAQGNNILNASGAILLSLSDTRHEFHLKPGESLRVAMKIPYVPDTQHLMKPATLADFDAAHDRVRNFWKALLASGADIEVPEERVNHVWRALLLQNFVLADGPRLTYSSGIRYNDSTYPQESAFAAHVFAMYGFKDYADALQPWFVGMSVTTEGAGRKYQTRRAMVLHHLFENYRLTGKTDLFDRFKADYYRVADQIASDRHSTMHGDPSALHWGLLPPDKPGADVQSSTQTGYVLGHNITNCQGLQDFGRFLVVTGIDRERGQKYLDEAADFRKTLMSAMERAAIRVPGRPPFLDLQTLYFAKTPDYGPEPYDDLANGRLQGAYSHYWADMEFHYNFFNPGDAAGEWIADYLHARNGFTLGLTRSHDHAGGPFGYINSVYDAGYYNYRLRSGNTAEFLLGLYGRLAFGMSRYVYAASEGAPFIGYNTKDGGYVAAGLDFPNSASNADTLLMLRNALAMEELKDDIETGDIDLLRGVPRAWLESGKQIRVARLPTYFGDMAMQVTGERAGIRADIDPPARNARLLLYVRRPMKSVRVNGVDHRECFFANGIERLAPGAPRNPVVVR